MDPAALRRFRKTLRRLGSVVSGISKESGCCDGVSLAQCHVLLEIEQTGETTGGELARELGLDPSTLSRTVDGLVTIGLVQRAGHPGDRRVTLLSLTEQGTRTCDTLNRAYDTYFERVFEAIPEGRHRTVIESVEVLVGAILGRDPVSAWHQATAAERGASCGPEAGVRSHAGEGPGADAPGDRNV